MRTQVAVAGLGLGVVYIVLMGWAMIHLGYDTWGAFIVIPLIAIVTVPILRRVFSGEQAALFPIVLLGLGAKFAGSFVRYWVAFDAYGGSSDAARYHNVGKALAGLVRSGRFSPFEVVPRGIGTPFVERLTGLVYTIFGSSRLAGFLLFGWMGYIGAILFVQAAIKAIPGLAGRRYMALVLLSPTMVYWPSSTGKEAWMCLCLGAASYGMAKIFVGENRVRALLLITVSMLGGGFVRPHFAAIWLGAFIVALAVGLFTERAARGSRGRFANVLLVMVGIVGLVIVANVTLRYLDPNGGENSQSNVSSRVTAIFQSTEQRSNEGGSAFKTINTSSVTSWPYAIVRTLTRPMLFEANGLATLLPALEMAFFMVVGLFSWRRVAHVMVLWRRSPYVTFVLVVLFMFGVAFASIGNLGILTRQRSLVVPLLLLPLCLPLRVARVRRPVQQMPHVRDRVVVGAS